MRFQSSVLGFVIVLLLARPGVVFGADLDAGKIAQIAGVKATTTPDGVVRVGWPRTDVKVRVDGLPIRPFMGLGSWAAFMATPHGSMLMGDTVVFEDEVNPAMDAAFAAGLEVTALHNHFFFDEPKVYFMHIGGEGAPDKLAAGIKRVWDAIKGVRHENSQPARSFARAVPEYAELDAEALEKLVGAKGEVQNQVFKVTIGRTAQMHGLKFGGGMGLTTWMAFCGSNESAAVDGDFAMTAAEVQPVLKALRKANINVVALHNHMIGESPPVYFTHFWGKGRAAELARGLRSALDAQRQAADGTTH